MFITIFTNACFLSVLSSNFSPSINSRCGVCKFLGINLGVTGTPANWILALLVAGLTVYSQRLMNKNMASNMNGQQNQTSNMMMKIMTYYFPFAMFSITIGTPFAFGLYFLTGQIMTVVQSIIFKRPSAKTKK